MNMVLKTVGVIWPVHFLCYKIILLNVKLTVPRLVILKHFLAFLALCITYMEYM